jgi:aspartate aminotransferase-like enzyme
MSALLPHVDPEGLTEFSVVFTDRSLNHMSRRFQRVMTDISSTLKSVYAADAVALVPGGGTYAMEAVARQFANGARCLVVRNGYFSYRWSQILEQGGISNSVSVMKARPVGDGSASPFVPAPVDQVVERIRTERPRVVFAPHVETSCGMLLPDHYLRAVADATHEVGGLFVLDCIASGCIWVDMSGLGVDVLISAPQKGWSASPCSGLVMLGSRALDVIEVTQSSSFACDLGKWLDIMRAYEQGGHAYHATLPTDALKTFRDTMLEMRDYGFETLREEQMRLGGLVRDLLQREGYVSVAAEGFQAPGVVVCYTDRADLQNGSVFARAGVQIAAGVPLMCDEPEGFRTFRIGLFGLEKLHDPQATVARLQAALPGAD